MAWDVEKWRDANQFVPIVRLLLSTLPFSSGVISKPRAVITGARNLA